MLYLRQTGEMAGHLAVLDQDWLCETYDEWNEIVEKALGEATLNQSQQSQSQPKRQHYSGPGPEQEQSKNENTKTCQIPVGPLLPQIKVLSEWDYPRSITSICSTSGDGIWTCHWERKYVEHVTSQGKLQQEIHSAVRCTNICISPTTNSLWVCSEDDNSVMELTSKTLIRRFKTKDTPLCLCVTRYGHILVGTKHRITEYTTKGKPGLTIKTTLLWKPLVRSPCRITQCPVSENVAVVDRDMSMDGGKGKPCVIVMDKLQKVCKYGERQHRSRTGSPTFDPSDLTYDNLGHLVIADFDNKCLHLLSGDGQYLRLLHTDIDRPWTVCMDRKGVLWAGFGMQFIINHVKRLQHTGI